MDAQIKKEILSLSVSERILLVQEIWDSIADSTEAIALSLEEKAELVRRLELYQQNPSIGSSWDEVQKRIRE